MEQDPSIKTFSLQLSGNYDSLELGYGLQTLRGNTGLGPIDSIHSVLIFEKT